MQRAGTGGISSASFIVRQLDLSRPYDGDCVEFKALHEIDARQNDAGFLKLIDVSGEQRGLFKHLAQRNGFFLRAGDVIL